MEGQSVYLPCAVLASKVGRLRTHTASHHGLTNACASAVYLMEQRNDG